MQVILVFRCSFFTMTVLFYQLFEICDLLVQRTFVITLGLVRDFLCESMNNWSSTYVRNVGFLCATSFFIRGASSRMCLLYKG